MVKILILMFKVDCITMRLKEQFYNYVKIVNQIKVKGNSAYSNRSLLIIIVDLNKFPAKIHEILRSL